MSWNNKIVMSGSHTWSLNLFVFPNTYVACGAQSIEDEAHTQHAYISSLRRTV